MRSKEDLEFSSLCDRVGRANITNDDEHFLRSRILNTDIENCNDSFKTGKISIVVTTNLKKDLVNCQKLNQLLPNQKEFVCNCVDRVLNLPSGPKLSEKDQKDLNKTGNLPRKLILKVGAPVVITSNHSKAKYREDGIVNGARGFVQAIQTSKENIENVEVVWVVFNNEKMGRQYRFDHNDLRQDFNPGHPLATPILPERKKFALKGGNIQYQRTNFALSLAYAITAHKCQGETLEYVVIDFGPDKEHGIKNYVCPGSFYVALTRVRSARNFFLRSFDKSYILANGKIQEKIDAMRKFNAYQFKKIYVDQQIFETDEEEIKAGYLNINGLIDGGHVDYLNEDKNLRNLHVLVISETKLNAEITSSEIEVKLSNWIIIRRDDAGDDIKHMGLLLLAPKTSKIMTILKGLRYQKALRIGKLQIQGLILRFTNNVNIGFIYCRTTPNNEELKSLKKTFEECQIIMGDLNLSPRIEVEQKKLNYLCKTNKYLALKEITRRASNNQPDHILVDKSFEKICFATSYFNFISDHNSIVIRFGGLNNEFTSETLQKLNFDSELHLKSKRMSQKQDNIILDEEKGSSSLNAIKKFRRKIINPDMSSCWLNACLHLILTALDHSTSGLSIEFFSEVGRELKRMQTQNVIDPTSIKEIIVFAEDTRIASRKSEVMSEILDLREQERRLRQIDQVHLDLSGGQQCVRDFFLCLNENALNWTDVHEFLSFQTVDLTICNRCQNENRNEIRQIYLEMEVPPHGSNLAQQVEQYFNESNFVEYICGLCEFQLAEKRLLLKSAVETNLITVLLRRSVRGENENEIVANEINAVDDLKLM